jgi:hypothetical protein
MDSSNKSFQQLDPVGGYGTRPLTVLLSIITVVYASVQTAFGWFALGYLPLEWLALAAIVLASVALVYFSSALRAPFPRVVSVAILLLAITAMLLDAATTWSGAIPPPGEWGPVGLGLTILQLSPYRPAREIGGATVIAAVVAGFVVILHPESSLPGAPMLVTLVTSTFPLMAFGFGATAYASSLSRALRRMPSASVVEQSAASDELRERVMRSVQQDRVGILNRTVVPFFTELLRRDRVSSTDRETARTIAQSIRSIMVAEADRSWLDTVVEQVSHGRGDGSLPGSEVVQDDDRLAAGMSTEQRIVVRALLVALFEHPGFDPDGFAVALGADAGRCVVTLTAKLDLDESIPRSGLGAYLAVLRVVFGDLQLTFQSPTLTLRFSYEHK